MRCGMCNGTGRTLTDKYNKPPLYGANFICTECNGSGVGHCCDGLQCQPTTKQMHMTEIVEDMDGNNA